jgi:hypothetical protein
MVVDAEATALVVVRHRDNAAAAQQQLSTMPHDEHGDSTSGILSGVFSFVSRELESFAVNAGLVSTSNEVCTVSFCRVRKQLD